MVSHGNMVASTVRSRNKTHELSLSTFWNFMIKKFILENKLANEGKCAALNFDEGSLT